MNNNILVLGGYSKNNISWIEDMKSQYKLNYNVNIIKYDNWYNEREMDFDHEIIKIYNIIKDKKIDIIIAKSIGIYLITRLIHKYNLENKIIIFMGYPLNVLKEENIDIKEDIIDLNKNNKLYIIQQENDPLCNYDELLKVFNNEISSIKINGNDHAYKEIIEIKEIVDKIIVKNKEK